MNFIVINLKSVSIVVCFSLVIGFQGQARIGLNWARMIEGDAREAGIVAKERFHWWTMDYPVSKGRQRTKGSDM